VVGGTVAHPLVAEVDDETLRSQMLDVVRQLVGLPEPKVRAARAGRPRSARAASA
jgi:hypothetical protein